MIVREDIEKWASLGESETLELKRSTGARREAAKSLCAMLNHRGGMVIFGIEPNGKIVGQRIGDQTIEHLSQTLNEIEPTITPTIDRVALDNASEALVVKVEAGRNRPYTYRKQAYRRVGNTDHAMDTS